MNENKDNTDNTSNFQWQNDGLSCNCLTFAGDSDDHSINMLLGHHPSCQIFQQRVFQSLWEKVDKKTFSGKLQQLAETICQRSGWISPVDAKSTANRFQHFEEKAKLSHQLAIDEIQRLTKRLNAFQPYIHTNACSDEAGWFAFFTPNGLAEMDLPEWRVNGCETEAEAVRELTQRAVDALENAQDFKSLELREKSIINSFQAELEHAGWQKDQMEVEKNQHITDLTKEIDKLREALTEMVTVFYEMKTSKQTRAKINAYKALGYTETFYGLKAPEEPAKIQALNLSQDQINEAKRLADIGEKPQTIARELSISEQLAEMAINGDFDDLKPLPKELERQKAIDSIKDDLLIEMAEDPTEINPDVCQNCDGTGWTEELVDCTICGGTGRKRIEIKQQPKETSVICTDCSGTGGFVKPCYECRGTGRVNVMAVTGNEVRDNLLLIEAQIAVQKNLEHIKKLEMECQDLHAQNQSLLAKNLKLSENLLRAGENISTLEIESNNHIKMLQAEIKQLTFDTEAAFKANKALRDSSEQCIQKLDTASVFLKTYGELADELVERSGNGFFARVTIDKFAFTREQHQAWLRNGEKLDPQTISEDQGEKGEGNVQNSKL